MNNLELYQFLHLTLDQQSNNWSNQSQNFEKILESAQRRETPVKQLLFILLFLFTYGCQPADSTEQADNQPTPTRVPTAFITETASPTMEYTPTPESTTPTISIVEYDGQPRFYADGPAIRFVEAPGEEGIVLLQTAANTIGTCAIVYLHDGENIEDFIEDGTRYVGGEDCQVYADLTTAIRLNLSEWSSETFRDNEDHQTGQVRQAFFVIRTQGGWINALRIDISDQILDFAD